MHVGTTVRLLTSDALPKSLSSQPVDRILVCTGHATCQTKFPLLISLRPPSGSTLACTGMGQYSRASKMRSPSRDKLNTELCLLWGLDTLERLETLS